MKSKRDIYKGRIRMRRRVSEITGKEGDNLSEAGRDNVRPKG